MWWSCKVKNLETTPEIPRENLFPQFFSQATGFSSLYFRIIWENKIRKSRKGGKIVLLPADYNFTVLLIAKISLSGLNWWLILETA